MGQTVAGIQFDCCGDIIQIPVNVPPIGSPDRPAAVLAAKKLVEAQHATDHPECANVIDNT